MENILNSVENMQETPVKSLMQSKPTMLDCITPAKEDQEMDQKSENSGNDLRKSSTPDPLKVPKAFKYPERYRSPTDLMMSPITKGLLARNRKGGALLPPSLNQPKVQGVEVQDVVAFKIEIKMLADKKLNQINGLVSCNQMGF